MRKTQIKAKSFITVKMEANGNVKFVIFFNMDEADFSKFHWTPNGRYFCSLMYILTSFIFSIHKKFLMIGYEQK